MRKSWRIPPMLTLYSSVSPGRMNRATWPVTTTLPVHGRGRRQPTESRPLRSAPESLSVLDCGG